MLLSFFVSMGSRGFASETVLLYVLQLASNGFMATNMKDIYMVYVKYI